MDKQHTRAAIERVLKKYHINNKAIADEILEAINNGKSNIFTWYENNIGAITPIMRDQLLQAEDDYSEEWVREAFTLAVNNNARKWSYVNAILENWRINGYKANGRDKPISQQQQKVELPQPRLICDTGQRLKHMAERDPERYINEYRDHIDTCHLCGGASNAGEIQKMVHNLAERMRA